MRREPPILLVVLVSVLLWYALSLFNHHDRPDTGDVNPSVTTEGVTEDVQDTASQVASQSVSPGVSEPPDHSALAKVTQIVEENTAENQRRMEMFRKDGWKEVEVNDPPNAEVMQLSMALLGTHEKTLQSQIQSNSFTSDMLDRLTEIALATQDDKTRYVAIEALGRAGDKSAQLHLMQAFEGIPDEATRSQVLGYLVPQEPNDEIAVFLAEQIADPSTTDSLKQQSAFPLALVGLMETSVPQEAVERTSEDIPDEWMGKFSAMVRLLANGGPTKGN